MAGKAATTTFRQVKPILSIDRDDARRKALMLYKAWIRQVPSMCKLYFLLYIINYKAFAFIT